MRAIIIGLIGAIMLLSVGLAWFAFASLTGGGTGDPFRDRFDPDAPPGGAVDSAARIEIELLRDQLERMQGEISTLRSRLQALERRPASGGPRGAFGADPGGGVWRDQGPNDIIDAYAQVVLIANRRQVNRGLKVGGPRFLEEFLGRPRETLTDSCQPMTNPTLKALLKVEQVGPIRVTMLQPALGSLRRVFANVEAADPDLYARINTAGALCVRQIRGTRGRLSTHAFGLAVDLNIDGRLDTLGDGRTQLGLTILADFFHQEGWVWGAGFSREDSMHFEVSRQMLERWRSEGMI